MTEAGPLTGWRVAVTRPREQAGALCAALSQAGATPIEVPTIALVEPSDGGAGLRRAAAGLARYSWVVFTSANGVERLWRAGAAAASFAGVGVAAIGEATAAALERRRILVDLVPERFVAESLAEAFPPAVPPASGGRRQRVLLPRAAGARDVLPRALTAKGYEVDVVEAYRTVHPPLAPAIAELVLGADAACFTSSSTVTGWLEILGADALPPVVACIGPVTAATAREAGVEVTVEASEHTVDGLVEALCAYASATHRL